MNYHTLESPRLTINTMPLVQWTNALACITIGDLVLKATVQVINHKVNKVNYPPLKIERLAFQACASVLTH